MTITEFIDSDGKSYSHALHALWLAYKGDWEQAHEVAQSDDGRESAWVHAYLHRVEGDTINANYWYRRAGRPIETGELDAEWGEIVVALLQA